MSSPRIIEHTFKLEEMYEEFYPNLSEQVFHYTPGTNLKSILSSRLIEPIKKGVAKTSAHSHESMGNYLYAVCLFDLRSKSINKIEKIRGWYNFLAPRLEDNTLAYFILSPQHYSDITILSELSEEAKEEAMYLPHIESWHKNALCLSKIEVIYVVKTLK